MAFSLWTFHLGVFKRRDRSHNDNSGKPKLNQKMGAKLSFMTNEVSSAIKRCLKGIGLGCLWVL